MFMARYMRAEKNRNARENCDALYNGSNLATAQRAHRIKENEVIIIFYLGERSNYIHYSTAETSENN